MKKKREILEIKGLYEKTDKQKEHAEYIKSEEWKHKRDIVLVRDNFKCSCCGDTENLNVHHITYENYKDEYLHELITLCKKCHYKAHKKHLIIMILNKKEMDAFKILNDKLSAFNKDVICVAEDKHKISNIKIMENY